MSEWKDPIVEEIRQARQQILKEHDHDPKKLIAHLMEEQKKHDDRLVDYRPKKDTRRAN